MKKFVVLYMASGPEWLATGNRRANSGIIISIAFMQAEVTSWSPILAACKDRLAAVSPKSKAEAPRNRHFL